MARNFKRLGARVQHWIRNDKPEVFVTHHPRIGSRAGVFYVLRAVERVPAGRLPWTVNNKRQDRHLGEHPFTSLGPALSFAEGLQ